MCDMFEIYDNNINYYYYHPGSLHITNAWAMYYMIGQLHNCHHVKLCPPLLKQYITTHRNKNFIVMDSSRIVPS